MASTIKDLALRTSASIAAVSRALNGTCAVTDQTRLRVQRAAKHLRYAPHHAARSLGTRPTEIVDLLLPDRPGEDFSELTRGIDRTARYGRPHLPVSRSVLRVGGSVGH